MRNNILIIGSPQSGKLSLVKYLTGSLPPDLPSFDENPSHNGLTHAYKIKTKYYTHEAKLWVDEYCLPDQGITPIQENYGKFYGEEDISEKLTSLIQNASLQPESEIEPELSSVKNSNPDFEVSLPSLPFWIQTFTSSSASEIRDSLGAVIFTFSPSYNTIETAEFEEWGKLIDCLEDEEWNGATIAFSNTTLDRKNSRTLDTDDYQDMLFDRGIQLATDYDQLISFIQTNGSWVQAIADGQGTDENCEKPSLVDSVTIARDQPTDNQSGSFEIEDIIETETSLGFDINGYTEFLDDDYGDDDNDAERGSLPYFKLAMKSAEDLSLNYENSIHLEKSVSDQEEKIDNLEFFLEKLAIIKREFKSGKLDKSKTWEMCNDMATEFLDL